VEFGKGIGIVEILRSSNIVALVGGGPNPAFPPTNLVLWDDAQPSNNRVAEIQCSSPICGVKIQLDKIVLSLSSHIFIYDTRNMSLIEKYETFPNPRGTCALSGTLRQTLTITTPEDRKGYVRMQKFNPPCSVTFKAHEGSLRCMCLSRDGRYLATTSDNGTLIRIFDSSPSSVGGKQLFEFRRGSDPAEIFSMSFSPEAKFLVVNSDKYEAHIFSIARPELNETSKLNGWGFGAYMSSIWSATRISLPEVFSRVAFVSEREIVAVCHDRSYFKYELMEADGHLTAARRGYIQLDEKRVVV